MRSIRFLLTTLIITAVFAIGLTGCGDKDETTTEIASYEGPIEGWEDIAVPEDTVWEKSFIGGPVENHYFETPDMSQGELFAFLEVAMEVNGWTLNLSAQNDRQFIKDGDLTTYRTTREDEGVLYFAIIIEPAGTYDKNEEEEVKETE